MNARSFLGLGGAANLIAPFILDGDVLEGDALGRSEAGLAIAGAFANCCAIHRRIAYQNGAPRPCRHRQTPVAGPGAVALHHLRGITCAGGRARTGAATANRAFGPTCAALPFAEGTTAVEGGLA